MAIPNYYENDVTLAINSLTNSSPGWDNIPTLVAKHVIHCYIKPLVFLINQSLIEGVFPDELKLAKVIPVYKAGSSMELYNYRPISVLFFSKVYEKRMYNSLVSYFDNYNMLYQNQFGFRQGHSSHHALITLVNKITQSLDSGDMVVGIFLDLKKALDTVNHKILVKKLILIWN